MHTCLSVESTDYFQLFSTSVVQTQPQLILTLRHLLLGLYSHHIHCFSFCGHHGSATFCSSSSRSPSPSTCLHSLGDDSLPCLWHCENSDSNVFSVPGKLLRVHAVNFSIRITCLCTPQICKVRLCQILFQNRSLFTWNGLWRQCYGYQHVSVRSADFRLLYAMLAARIVPLSIAWDPNSELCLLSSVRLALLGHTAKH